MNLTRPELLLCASGFRPPGEFPRAGREEMKNLIRDAASQSALKEMKAELDRILKETNA